MKDFFSKFEFPTDLDVCFACNMTLLIIRITIQTRFLIYYVIMLFTCYHQYATKQFTTFSYKINFCIINEANEANRKTKILLTNLSAIPRFVRSDRVLLFYHGVRGSIKNKCQQVEKYLRPIKTALKHSNSIRFVANINQNDPTCFSDHSILLSYLSEQLLQICNSSRRYEFLIYFHSDKNAGTNVISSLLKMPPISRCSNLEITLYGIEEALQLPIETISDWLNRKKHDGRIPQEIFMTIYIYEIQNATEMCDHLSKVRFIFIVFLLPKPYFIFYGNIIKTRSFLRLGHCDL